RAMNMAPFIFWNLAFYTIIRTQLRNGYHHIVSAKYQHVTVNLFSTIESAVGIICHYSTINFGQGIGWTISPIFIT
ncbi:hypothetical protein ABNF03_03120, partial [Paenibacillus larvae]